MKTVIFERIIIFVYWRETWDDSTPRRIWTDEVRKI